MDKILYDFLTYMDKAAKLKLGACRHQNKNKAEYEAEIRLFLFLVKLLTVTFGFSRFENFSFGIRDISRC